jgi:hypothetical protein
VVGNGSHQPRKVLTSAGAVEVVAPRGQRPPHRTRHRRTLQVLLSDPAALGPQDPKITEVLPLWKCIRRRSRSEPPPHDHIPTEWLVLNRHSQISNTVGGDRANYRSTASAIRPYPACGGGKQARCDACTPSTMIGSCRQPDDAVLGIFNGTHGQARRGVRGR